MAIDSFFRTVRVYWYKTQPTVNWLSYHTETCFTRTMLKWFTTRTSGGGFPRCLSMRGNAYQFKSRDELFRFLQSVNAQQHNITYSIANLPYLPTLTPKYLWQSLDFNYRLNQLGKALQPRRGIVR